MRVPKPAFGGTLETGPRSLGRIRFNHKTYPHEAHIPWRWFLNDTERNRMADGLCGEEAMIAFPEAFDTAADNTVDKSA